jgi:class 3 adenylate cyclase
VKWELMMPSKDELKAEILKILKGKWERRDGQQVPEAEKIQLGNHAVSLEGTVLYADINDSTDLVNEYKDWFAAEVYKSYLLATCRIIRDDGGTITAFDGDRVMAVYIGKNKNTSAVRSALKINYAVKKIINPAIKAAYPDTAFQLRQAVGIDSSSLFVARTGVRGDNDLVWVGRAANYAAKLSGLGEDRYSAFITEQVYKRLNESAKMGGSPSRLMWEKDIWDETGITIYKSNWWWQIP